MKNSIMVVSLVCCLATVGGAQLPPVPAEAAGDAGPTPKIVVEQSSIDLGTVLEGDKVGVSWILKNTGQANLIIEHTRATCGCTVVTLDEKDKVIPPGESLKFKAKFDSRGRRGLQKKYISVYTNDPAQPITKLRFTAMVHTLFEIKPASLMNMGTVRRGETGKRSIDILPGRERERVEILALDAPAGSPVLFTHKEFKSKGRTGQRISMAIADEATPGPVNVILNIKLRVDGIERQRPIAVRGQIVGALTWQPAVVDATRAPSPWGKRFAPVTLRSTDSVPFKILDAQAGPLFDVTTESTGSPAAKTSLRVLLTLRKGSPPGPFGTMLVVRTDLLEQPQIEVPVFGIVADPVKVDPSLILLRQDGTPLGMQRRVKLQALPRQILEVSEVVCDRKEVSVRLEQPERERYRHIRFLDVRLEGTLPPGRHEATVTVKTNVPGAEQLVIPVAIDVPGTDR